MAYTIVGNWSISSELILKAAQSKGLRSEVLDSNKNLYVIYHPKTNVPLLFKASAIMKNNVVGSRIADYKDLTFKVIQKFIPDCPLPRSISVVRGDDVSKLLIENNLSYPLVSKPLDGAHGEGVIVNIKDEQTLHTALEQAFAYNSNNKAIVQEMLQGSDFRVLVVGFKVVSVSKRIPAFVTGDGVSSIQELVDKENNHPLRGRSYSKPLSFIELNEESKRVLEMSDLTFESVPKLGDIVFLKKTANLSTGGVAIDFTDEIHSATKEVSEKIARILGLGLVAIDFVTEDISQDLSTSRGGLIEINDTPGLRMHHFPYEGKSRNVAEKILDYVFQDEAE